MIRPGNELLTDRHWAAARRFPTTGLKHGYSIILRKSPVPNVKIFRGPTSSMKSCKCTCLGFF